MDSETLHNVLMYALFYGLGTIGIFILVLTAPIANNFAWTPCAFCAGSLVVFWVVNTLIYISSHLAFSILTDGLFSLAFWTLIKHYQQAFQYPLFALMVSNIGFDIAIVVYPKGYGTAMSLENDILNVMLLLTLFAAYLSRTLDHYSTLWTPKLTQWAVSALSTLLPSQYAA